MRVGVQAGNDVGVGGCREPDGHALRRGYRGHGVGAGNDGARRASSRR